MALTVADYLYKQLRPSAPKIGLNVCKMEVPKPLIAKVPAPAEGQYIQVEATADLEQNCASLKWRSVTKEGKLIQDHAHCTVKYEDMDNWAEEWGRTNYMVQTQIDLLKQKMQTGDAHKIMRGMAYKLFKALVTYDDKYRGMEEVILDGKNTEATASVKFQTKPEDGDFYCSPYWIDSMAHISGFIVNASDLIDSDEHVYISHGWGSMRVARQLSADKHYRSYVRMQPAPGNVSVGDVYVFEGNDIVAVVGGLKFQQIPRRLLNTFLPPNKGLVKAPAAATKAAPIKAAAPAPIKTQTIIAPKTIKAPVMKA
ncbi:polyketide synthase, partial [Cryomyces antarcticus]